MEKFFYVLIFVLFLHFSYQAPTGQRCPPCTNVCKNRNISLKVRKECPYCQCEPLKDINKIVVPVVLCPFKICSESCGFMGYKLDNMGCKSCECQEI